MRMIDLAFKDIRQVVRDRRSLLFLLIMPVVFTYFFGFAFTKSGEQKDNRLKVGVVDHDPQGLLSTALIDLLGSSTTVQPLMLAELTSAQVDQMVLQGDLAAVLVIPADFSVATLRGEDPRLEVIMDEESNSGQTVRRALQANITRLLSMVETARLSINAYQAQTNFSGEAERTAYLEDALKRAFVAWMNQPLTIQVTGPVDTPNPLDENPYNQFSPGMMVQFAIFGLVQAAMVMVIDRKTGAMARLLTTPMRKSEVIAGHTLGMFLIFFAQQALLVIFGQVALKVDYLRQPIAMLILITALSAWVASLGLLISALAKREEQVIMFSMLVMFVFSALGGTWFSLEMVGKTFAAVGHLTPTAWAMDGFQNIILRGLGVQSVLQPAGVLLGYTAAFFGLAVWRFKFE